MHVHPMRAEDHPQGQEDEEPQEERREAEQERQDEQSSQERMPFPASPPRQDRLNSRYRGLTLRHTGVIGDYADGDNPDQEQ
jgi:hypothetical protein